MGNNLNYRLSDREHYKVNPSSEDESKVIILEDLCSDIERVTSNSGEQHIKDLSSMGSLHLKHKSTVRGSSGIDMSILILILIISVGMTLVFADFIKSNAKIDLTIQRMISVLANLGNFCLLVMILLRKNTKHFLQSRSGNTSNFGLLGQTLRVGTQTIILHIFAIGTLSYHILMLIKVIKSLQSCTDSPISLCMYLSLAVFSVLQLVFIWMFIDMKCASFLARTLMSFVFGANINLYLCVLIEETVTALNESGTNSTNITETCEMFVSPQPGLNNSDTVYGDVTDEASHFLYPFVVEYSLMAVQLLYAVWDISLYKITTEIEISDSYLELHSADEEMPLLRVKGRVYNCRELKRMYALYIGLIINISLCIVTFLKGIRIVHLFRNVLALAALVPHFVLCIIGLVFNRNANDTKTDQSLQPGDVMLFITAGSVSFFHSFRFVAILNFVPTKEKSGSSDDNVNLLMFVAIFHLLSAYSQTLFLRNCPRIRLSSMLISRQQFLNLQICAYVLVTNISFWIIDSFMPHHMYDNSPIRDIPLEFYGITNWISISNILVPLLIYYRLHCVFLCLDLLKKP
ncbi:hypothetical protein CHS0354_009332 [Potamilus streckersoni]|uniref:Uncharacterized protein n=1 Tax=Potamilus streckersoni TaxID=2493646 RepID=A0AAE0VZN1_9BIVA|nr:hypothetical protein CHS0354_009332 [Potamilus streckersoni]